MSSPVGKQLLLLVDDNAMNLRVTETSLRKNGFTVITATGGQEALGKLEHARPDLIITNTRMSKMDGFELCRAVKSDPRYKSIPLVFLTSEKSAEQMAKGLELGGDDFLTRPIYSQEMMRRVRVVLQRAAQREAQTGFVGNLSELALVDLVQTFQLGSKTGVIRIEGNRIGALHLREGRVVDAEVGRLRGEKAFYRLLGTFEGKFEVAFVAVDKPDQIGISTQGLLIEGVRRMDEAKRMLEQLPRLDTVFEIDHRQLATRPPAKTEEVDDLLRLFDARRTLHGVVVDSDLDNLTALQTIGELLAAGVIRASNVGGSATGSGQSAVEEAMNHVQQQLSAAEPELPESHFSPPPNDSITNATMQWVGEQRTQARVRASQIDYEPMMRKAALALRLQQYKAAADDFRLALQIQPDSVDAKMSLGIALVHGHPGQSDYYEAATLLQETSQERELSSEGWLALGLALEFTGRKQTAIDAYQRYLSLEPTGAVSREVRSALQRLICNSD